MSYLQQYVRQLKPRNESYTPPVSKVQNFLAEAKGQVLGNDEFYKYGGERARLFLKHIEDEVPFETVDGKTTTIKWINDSDKDKFEAAIGTEKAAFNSSLKSGNRFKPTFVTPKGDTLKVTDLVKTAAYGGKGGTGEPRGADWEDIITHHYNNVIGKLGHDKNATAKVKEKWENKDNIGQTIAENFVELIGKSAMTQYGAGKSKANLSDFWLNPAEGVVGGTDGTPKTDMYNKYYNISLKKAGGSQLASGGKGETLSTFYAALEHFSEDKRGDKVISGIMSAIEKNFKKLSTSFSKDQLEKISKSKEKQKELSDKDKAAFDQYITTEAFHKKLNKALDSELNKVTSNSEFKEWFIFEAMSGYKKFKKQQAVSSVCIEFNADTGSVSEFYKVTSDGKKGGLSGITSVSGDIKSVAGKAKIFAAWKSQAGNPYSSLRISNSYDPFNHNYDNTTLMGCIRKTIHEDKISQAFLIEETQQQLDEFKFIGRTFDKLKKMGKNAILWVKNLIGKILKAVSDALNKIKQMGEKMFSGLFKFLGIKPEVKASLPKNLNGFIYGMAD